MDEAIGSIIQPIKNKINQLSKGAARSTGFWELLSFKRAAAPVSIHSTRSM
ncbi:hypothetical protein [Methylorubrum extorquens]|uniref:hypothetical protein n=1 Tax=Methylorubrum extorquens TaxID=408 RepID=UPI001AEBE82F|nr:hypothetical protein [Methylorubrum extorquens]